MGKNKKRPDYKKVYIILLVIATFFMSLGYAVVNSVTLDISGSLSATAQDGVFITDVKFINGTGENSQIISAYQTMLTSNVVLPSSESSVTMQITIYNSTSSLYTFEGVTAMPGDDTYSNQNITYSLNGLVIGQQLNAGGSVIFTVTFNYVDKTNTAVNNLKSLLNFEFEEYIETVITYDYNYLPNNQFESLYDATNFRQCCGASSGQYFSSAARTVGSDGLIYYSVTQYPNSNFGSEWVRGYYFVNLSSPPLENNKQYTLVFEAKGNEKFTAIIGSEQGGEHTYQIYSEWTRYAYTFTAIEAKTSTGDLLMAFVVYDWGNNSSARTLELRNVQMQSGGSELYTTTSTLRANRALGDSVTTPTRSGWNFDGWFTEAIGGTQVTSDTLVPEEATTYYAHWSYSG